MLALGLALFGVLFLGACVHSWVYEASVEDRFPPLGERVSVDGEGIHVISRGPDDAPPVMMIHGASANAYEFTYTLAPHLDDRFRILMPDRPGHGYSQRPDGAWRLGRQAELMAGVLRRKAGGRAAIIVGHSFGGAVALRLALDHPDLVSGLVLISPVTHDWRRESTSWYNEWTARPVVGSVLANMAPLVGPAMARDGLGSTFEPAEAPENYYEKSALGLLFRPGAFRANARDMVHLREELARQEHRYATLEVPIIVFSGADDTVLDPRIHAGQLKQQADVELVKLPDGGHMPHHAHGEDVAEAIARLASRVPAE